MAKRTQRRRTSLSGPSLARRLERAFSHHEAGRLDEAAKDYAQVVRADPSLAEAWHGFGVLALQRGENGPAMDRLERAVALAPDRGDYLSNLGAALEAAGALERARQTYARTLAIEPDDVDTLFNSALVEARLGDPAAACATLERAVKLAPKDAELWLNLSRYALEVGEVARSRSACERGEALAVPALSAQFEAQRGALAHHDGELERAEGHYQRAVEVPTPAAHHVAALGEIRHELGRLDEAQACYQRALELDPALRATRINLAALELGRGQVEAAFERYWALYRETPEVDSGLAQALAHVLRHAYPSRWDREMQAFLVAGFDDDGIDPEDLASAAAAQIRADPRLALSARLASGSPESMLLDAGTAQPLVLALLRSTPNLSASFETLLVSWRAWLLQHTQTPSNPAAATQLVLGAFAEQTYANEYLWAVTPSEEVQVEQAGQALEDGLTGRLTGASPNLEAVVGPALRYAMYRPLHALSQAAQDALVQGDLQRWPALARLVQRVLREPRKEAALAAALPRLGAIEEATSRAVRAQYEGFPYPRWVRIPSAEREHLRLYMGRHFPTCSPGWLAQPFRALVAGCGTGQEPLRLALTCPESEVVGVDLSRASLGYAERKRRELGIDNLTLHHGDLRHAEQLGQFEVVIANGVLHHMTDPRQGWHTLRQVLAPAGLMKIGLYSERARASVVAAREVAERHGWVGDRASIAALRALVCSGEVPALEVLAESEDFYTTSGCRDLLFHACEHRFTLEHIAQMIESLDLEMVGFEQPEGAAGEHFGATDPSRPEIERWTQVEHAHPDTFAGMYQFWVQARP